MLSHLCRAFRHNCLFWQQQCCRYKPRKSSSPPPPPPALPKPPKKPQSFTFHDATWEDPYSWMSKMEDKVAMRHMDIYMEQEEKYTEAVLADTDRIQTKLQSELASRLSFELSTPPLLWGPLLYYRRVEEGKQYPVLCRRLASLQKEFISHKSPAAGFDFTSGKRIEQKLLDYNQEAERFGGYAYEEMSEISPDHKFLAYTMYDKDNDYFKLCVGNLNSGALCSKPHADRVSNIAWAKKGQALLCHDNIPKDVLYPAVLVTSSFNTRFGVWEAAKWVARVRDNTFHDPKRPVLLNLTTDIVEETGSCRLRNLR